MNDNPQPQEQYSIPPEQLFSNAATPLPPKKHFSRKKLVVITSITGLFLFGAFMIFKTYSVTSSSCLSPSDFTALTGYAPAEPFSPTENFYTEYVLFIDDSPTSYDDADNGAHGYELMKKIGDFYNDRSTKPMAITITGDSASAEIVPRINQRISTVRSSLLAYGVPNEIITSKNAETVLEIDDETEAGFDGAVYVTLTSSPTCK